MAAGSTPTFLYAGWDGSQIVLIENGTAPAFDATLGQWVYPGNANYAVVAYARANGLSTPQRFLRNYYNGPGTYSYMQSLAGEYPGTWDGVERQLTNMPMLLLPGDVVTAWATANVICEPNDRVGDLIVQQDSTVVARARHTHSGSMYVWRAYHCSAGVIRLTTAEAPKQVVFYMNYLPIATNGGAWTVQGEAASTRLSVNITPYKWA